MGVRYRREDTGYLERAVNSILRQTWEELELLICEYGSTDQAKQRLKRFSQEDRRVRLLDGRAPGTLSQNLNDCLCEAQGDYVARMDDDDRSHPDRLEKQLAYLAEHPQCAFVGCNVSLYQNGIQAGTRSLPEYPTVQDFYITQPYIHPALIFHREALDVVNGYSEDRRQELCEDYDLLLRLYAKGYQGANLQEILFDYTLPATAMGGRRMRHRWNETATRWRRFEELGVLPGALPWVVKPLAVGLLPEPLLKRLKERRWKIGPK